ncbi:hypothetical protein PIB30_055852 [Stylosanthes scabra]|uniref:Uncharacterized protein n=1 Tax=Stylosanthes scabra TaxID=79078 RepID=A0ABU6RJ37_9FABA|nr:hypothetical protein [Stylosanthes scabra]
MGTDSVRASCSSAKKRRSEPVRQRGPSHWISKLEIDRAAVESVVMACHDWTTQKGKFNITSVVRSHILGPLLFSSPFHSGELFETTPLVAIGVSFAWVIRNLGTVNQSVPCAWLLARRMIPKTPGIAHQQGWDLLRVQLW